MIIKAFVGRDRVCEVCGKEFLITQDWVYKRGHGDGLKWFCSWKCLRSYEGRQLTKAERHEAMLKMLEQGKSVREIADSLCVDSRSVYYWKYKFNREGSK